MTSVRRITSAGALSAAILLTGCAGWESATKTPSTTTTTIPAAALKAALLTQADLPGTTIDTEPSSGGQPDFAACFPDHPIAVEGHPSQVDGPDLEVVGKKVDRGYSSSVKQASPAEARAYVAALAAPGAATCMTDAIKTFFKDTPEADTDAAGLTGTTAVQAVGDGGAVYSIRGRLTSGGTKLRLESDTVVFYKGGLLVTVDAGAIGGAITPGQAGALAQRIAGRLPASPAPLL